MNLIDRLYQEIMETPLAPKILLADSYAQGTQLLEQMCRRYGAVFHVEVQTLRGLVTKHAKLEMFRKQITLLDEMQSLWVVRYLMKQLTEKDQVSYITDSMLKLGIVRSVHHTLMEMRLAGIQAKDVKAEHFTNLSKGEYLQRLLALYESYLAEHKLTDFAGLIEYVNGKEEDTRYLAFSWAGWSRIERLMLERLAGERLCLMEAGAPFNLDKDYLANSFSMFRAAGSLAEIREGFRRIVSDSGALDHTEIMLSDYEHYAPIVFSHAEKLGIPCTFSSGLPLVFCSAGRAAAGILDWITEGFPVAKLTELLRHGCLSFQDERWSRSDWIRLLEKSGIGWGRERYLAAFRPERLQEQDREQGAVLSRYFSAWFDGLPGQKEWNPLLLLKWLADFIKNIAVISSPEDAAVSAALQEMAGRCSPSLGEQLPVNLAVQYVKEMLSEIRIHLSPAPQPGAIHVTSLQNGGWSGRKHTWIAGMDERAWSISAAQDPLLLDQEKRAVSTSLIPKSDRAKQIRNERESRLSLIRGEIWLSYSSYDPGEQKSQGPAFEMLQMLRLRSAEPALDFGALEQELGEPVRVMNIVNSAVQSAQQLILQSYPSLADGLRAQRLRAGEQLSAYDGWVPNAGSFYIHAEQEEPQDRHFVSVTQLEKYASCGLHYYFYYLLKLRPKEIPQYDPARWLQASERGSLLHDIFRRYLEEVTAQGAQPAAHDQNRLNEIAEAVIEETVHFIPAPNPHVFAKECGELRRDVDIFYRHEVLKTDQPYLFELELAAPNGEPMELQLPGGIRFRLKGFVDRVDRIGPHEYRIIDYKTGSTSKYKESEYFSGGSQLQHALYSMAVEQWLRDTGIDPEARVTEAEYYFPTERGRGEYVRRTQNRRDDVVTILGQLLESQKKGIYVPTHNKKMCGWCDYNAVCGPHSEWMAFKRQSAGNEELLKTLLEVEAFD
ncbi:PD-(D/E)XK nuclease family protein [Paenibacillus pinistramenti]|uniref:PD-(D/E)XK nuclease family protein n=1 Tax=Paenibacillus pinistramenti TaxID=1768003 RepID=UPI00110956E2|nr:PD-(D/E)XK nuclease family protein [Paenibacillus pinistramenti]